MQKTEHQILSTRPLTQEIVEEAAGKNICIDCISFIETEPVKSIELEEKISQLSQKNITVVFTSMNAVEAAKEYLSQIPGWLIFTMGQTTKELVKESFGEKSIIGTADNASALADTIIEKGEKEIFFFCGDQRRDELPGKLKEKNIKIEEIVVYRTNPSAKKISKKYDGILFFSPSAVDSFFSINSINNDVVLFAIGNTTANVIRERTNNQIIIADQPGKAALAKKMIAYFKNP